MPLSLRSSSLFILACLYGTYGIGFASDSSISISSSNLIPPIFDKGDKAFLTSNCSVKDVDGSSFSSSFLGNTNSFLLSGQKHFLYFRRCTAPTSKHLISAGEDLTLTNLSTLKLDHNSSFGENALISGKNITISDSKFLIATNNQTTSDTTTKANAATPVTDPKGSVLRAEEKLTISHIHNKILFDSNRANFGAVIVNKEDGACTIEDNLGSISFLNNSASCSGGAIYNGNITFSNNKGPISFLNNSAIKAVKTTTSDYTGCGGAICSPKKKVSFSSNQGTCLFENNSAQESGGAIYAHECSLFTDAPTHFIQNSAEQCGGAIYARKLDITANADMSFINNKAKQGGAISLNDAAGDKSDSTTQPSLSIRVNSGDIIFKGNTTIATPGIRESIRILGDAEKIQFDTAFKSKIIFYDPFDVGAGIQINNDTKTYGGIVKLTAEDLSEEEKLEPLNYTSSALGEVTVKSGALYVTNGAAFNVMGLKVENSGSLVLGSGAKIGVYASTSVGGGAEANIQHLGIDVLSFLNPDSKPAKIEGLKVTLNEDISLETEDLDELYDNRLLSQALAVPFIEFGEKPDKKTRAQTSQLDPITTNPHYGYQGEWSHSWGAPVLSATPNGGAPAGQQDTSLFISWQPSKKYILSPERKGDLVTNTIWSSFIASQTLAEALQDMIIWKQYGLNGSIKAVGNHFYQSNHKKISGFTGQNGGYQAAIGVLYPSDATLGVAFGQLYGKIKAKGSTNAHSTEQTTVFSCYGRIPVLSRQTATHITWEASYGYSKEHMTTKYVNGITSQISYSDAHWHNTTYRTALSLEHPFLNWLIPTRNVAKSFDLIGFVSVEFLAGWQSSFTETGALPRSFDRGRGYNLSVPVGCTMEWYSPTTLFNSLLTTKIAYKPDVYRINPHNIMTIVANDEQINTKGVDMSRNALFVQLHDDFRLSNYTSMFIDYVFDAKLGYMSHRASTGLQKRF